MAKAKINTGTPSSPVWVPIELNSGLGTGSHAEGSSTTATGNSSHAEGKNTFTGYQEPIASVTSTTVTLVSGSHSFQVNDNIGLFTSATVVTTGKITGIASNVLTVNITPNASFSKNIMLLGRVIAGKGDQAHTEGLNTIASGLASHAEGSQTIASGDYSHAAGYKNISSGSYTHAKGWSNQATGMASQVEGMFNVSSGQGSHAEGDTNTASGNASHAEGNNNTVSGHNSHVEGSSNVVTNNISHAEGYNGYNHAYSSHIEGSGNITGYASIISGKNGSVLTIDSNHSFIVGDSVLIVDVNSFTDGLEMATKLSTTVTAVTNNTVTLNSATNADIGKVILLNKKINNFGRYSHAEGLITISRGNQSHSEGYRTAAMGDQSHAEGESTVANGIGSHAEGFGSVAGTPSIVTKILDFDDGGSNFGVIIGSNILPVGTSVSYDFWGYDTGGDTVGRKMTSSSTVTAVNNNGNNTYTIWLNDWPNSPSNTYSPVLTVSNGYTIGMKGNDYSHAEGRNTMAIGIASHAEGENTQANGNNSHAEGFQTIATGSSSYAGGFQTQASGWASHSEGKGTLAAGNFSHAEGDTSKTRNSVSYTIVSCNNTGSTSVLTIDNRFLITSLLANSMSVQVFSYDDGNPLLGTSTITSKTSDANYYYITLSTKITGIVNGGAFLQSTEFTGDGAHAEGYHTSAIGLYTHSEGNGTLAYGDHAHAEGFATTAIGISSHAEGSSTIAGGNYSHAQNQGTVAKGLNQTAVGKYNVVQGTPDSLVSTDNAFIIGNGTSNTSRSNAMSVTWAGNATFSGTVSSSITPTASDHLINKAYFDAQIALAKKYAP